jgi:hypothetical protein
MYNYKGKKIEVCKRDPLEGESDKCYCVKMTEEVKLYGFSKWLGGTLKG